MKSHFVVFVVQSPSCVKLFATPWIAARQAFLSPTISRSLLKFMSIESVMPSNHLILCCPLLLLHSIFRSFRVFFQWVGSLHQTTKVLGASASACVLPMSIQGCFPLGWTGLISLQSKFKNINSLAVSLLYDPNVTTGKTSIHDYWKNHSFDYTDVCWQSDVSAF